MGESRVGKIIQVIGPVVDVEFKAEDLPEMYITGWVQSVFGVHGIRKAMEQVGLENLSGRAVRDALASLKDFDLEGLIAPTYVSDEHPWFCEKYRMYETKKRKLYPVTDWFEPFSP